MTLLPFYLQLKALLSLPTIMLSSLSSLFSLSPVAREWEAVACVFLPTLFFSAMWRHVFSLYTLSLSIYSTLSSLLYLFLPLHLALFIVCDDGGGLGDRGCVLPLPTFATD